MLVAGFPPEPEEGDPVAAPFLLEIEEALLSFGRAAFAAERQVVVPADREVAPLLASVAAEYRAPLRSEGEEGERALLGVALTGGRDGELEGELARVPGVAVLGPDGGPLEIEERARREEGTGLDSGADARHPLTLDLVAGVEPRVGVAIGWVPGRRFDTTHFLARGVPVETIWPTVSGDPDSAWASEGSMGRVLEECGWSPRPAGEGEEGEASAEGPRWIPYPYVMQRMFGEEMPEIMTG